MKKKILYIGGLALIASFFSTSCELDACKVCKEVTYVNDKWDHEGSPAEFCGASLLAIEAQKDIVYSNTRTTWECK